MQLPPIVKKLRPYLTVKESDLDELRSLRFELAEETAKAYQTLLEKRRQVLWPKDKDMTELDRRTRLDGDVAQYEANYRFLAQLEEIVKERLEAEK